MKFVSIPDQNLIVILIVLVMRFSCKGYNSFYDKK